MMPTLKRPTTIAIVGAGAVGLSCAVHLLRAGYAVDVYDRGEPGEGASLGNAGIIAVSEALPVGRPSILRQVPNMLLDQTGPLVIRWRYLPRIAPWLIRFVAASRPNEVRRLTGALSALLRPAIEDWQAILRGTQGEGMLRTRGWLRVYRTEAQMRAVLNDVALLREHDVKVDVLDSGAVRDLEPSLAMSFAGGVLYRDVGNLSSPLGAMRILADLVRREGGRIHRRDIVRIETKDDRAVLVDNFGTVAADRVIVAAGAWSRRLVRTLGIDLPLDTERGYHAMLTPPAASLQRPVTVVSPGYTLAPMADGIRLTTSVEFAGLDAPPNYQRLRRMVAHAATVLPGLGATPTSEWLGFRPSMPNSLPVIGPLPDRPQILLAFGHGHVGLTLGPTTGRLITAIIDGRTPNHLAPFLPR